MKMNNALLFFFTMTSIVNCAVQELKQTNRYLQLRFQISNDSLPLFLPSILTKNNVSQIKIEMGALWNSQIQSKYPKYGISTIITNSSQVKSQFLQSLSSVFSISPRQQFLIQWFESKAFHSDPNDKLCIDQIEQLKRLMPCSGKAGSSQLLDGKIIMRGGYIGISILWKVDSLSIQIVIEKNKRVNNIAKMKIRKCAISSLIMKDKYENDLPISIIVADKLSNPQFEEIPIPSIQYNRFSKDRWYSNNKNIEHHVKFNENRKGILQIRTLSLKGMQLKSVLLFLRGQKINYQWKNEGKIIKIQLPITENVSQLHLSMKFESLFIPFDIQRSIEGSGEELMRIPIAFIPQQSLKQQMELFPCPQTSFKLMEVDFSIPFHVITFSIAIVGYLWIGLWRKWSQQTLHSIKQQKKLIQNSAMQKQE